MLGDPWVALLRLVRSSSYVVLDPWCGARFYLEVYFFIAKSRDS